MQLIPEGNLERCFHELVDQSIERRNLEISAKSRVYLVGMLTEAGKLLDLFDKPITFEFDKTLREGGFKKTKKMKEIGDYCLYLSGYFASYLEKNGKGQVEYHINIGSSAYSNAAISSSSHFFELSDKFPELRLVVNDLFPNLPKEIDTPQKLLEVYERWEKTKDPRCYSLLLSNGITPVKLN